MLTASAEQSDDCSPIDANSDASEDIVAACVPKISAATGNCHLLSTSMLLGEQDCGSHLELTNTDHVHAVIASRLPAQQQLVDTPRKKELKHKLRLKVRQCQRLRARLSSVPKQTTVNSLQSALCKLQPCLSPAAFSLLSAQVRLHNKSVRKWTDSERMIALSLYYQSPKAYRFLGKVMKLPSKSSISRWLQHIRVEPGLNRYMIMLLEARVKNLNEIDRECVLLMDEITLKKGLRYCKMRDIVVGYTDDGVERTAVMATSALVFMVRGLFKHWKQAISFVFTASNLKSSSVKQYVVQIIEALQGIGLRVRAIVSDQGGTFSKMFREWGVTTSQPSVNILGGDVMVFPDPPHLLKSMRNMLCHYDVTHAEGTAKWNHISQFFEQDIVKVYRLAPRLKAKHVNLPPFSQMKVKLASQVFSHSVAAGIETYISHGRLPEDALGTVTFCARMNDLFDCFNSSTVKCRLAPYRSALSSSSRHLTRLSELSKWLDSITVSDRLKGKDVTNRFRCIQGWKQAIEALSQLWQTLCTVNGVKFLFTRRINQDPLENFFCVVRQHGCQRDNPVPLEFMFAFKQVCINSLLVPSQCSNSEIDVDDLLAILTHKEASGMNTKSDDITNKKHSMESKFHAVSGLKLGCDILEQNGLLYFSGFLLKKLFAFHTCEECSKQREAKASENDGNKVFLFNKSFQSNKSPLNSLVVPADTFVQTIELFESVFSFTACSDLHRPALKQTVKNAIRQEVGQNIFCSSEVFNFVLDLFVRCRIYFLLKYLNEKELNEKKRKSAYVVIRKNRKASKVLHR